MPEEVPVDLQAIANRVEQLEAELSLAKAELARKDQIIAALQQKLFGSSSERLDPNQEHFDFDEEILGKPEPPSPNGDKEGGKESEKEPPKRTRRGKGDLFPRNLKVRVVETLIPKEVQADPDSYKEIAEVYHDELEAQRFELYYRRKVTKKYTHRENRDQPPVMAPAPLPSVPGTKCGPQLIAMILADKYCDHLPHYRQSDRFLRRQGVILSRQTLNGWTHAAGRHLLPLSEAIKLEIRGAEVLQIDETPADYLVPGLGKAAQGYFWWCRDAVTGLLYCEWRLGRGHDCLLDILGYDEESGTILYSGIIQCDGYSAYQALAKRFEDIRLAGCLAHIRRKFFEAREQAPELVKSILLEIQKLYRYERGLRQAHAPPLCRLLVRRGHSRKIVDDLKEKIREELGKHLPKSNLGEAITYALNQWKEFSRYLDDGRLEVDNNLIENAIRPTKLGLKNYLFIGSAEAGKTSALMYTLMGNCKALGIDPERYLAEVLRQMPPDATLEQAAELTPAKLAEKIRSQQPQPMGAITPSVVGQGDLAAA